MKHRAFLALSAAACAVLLTACGGRTSEEERAHSEVTTVRTERAETRTETTDCGSRTVRGVDDLIDDAAEDVSEAVSDAAENGKDILTGIASDASDAAADRRGDGDYRTDDDGRVEAQD